MRIRDTLLAALVGVLLAILAAVLVKGLRGLL